MTSEFGVVIVDEDNHPTFISPIMTKAEAEALKITLGAGQVVDGSTLRAYRSRMLLRKEG